MLKPLQDGMGLEIFIRGVLVGLMASIPLGPIGVLCIQRTLSKNHKAGFFSGLGAATADTVFATVAFFSLSFVLSLIEGHLTIIKAVGGMCVILVGSRIFFTNPVIQIRRNRAGKSNLWQDYLSIFLITLTNPALILVFVALFATFGFSKEILGAINGVTMIFGVFSGAALWWFTLTFFINLIRNKFRPRHLLWMNRIAGAVIIVLGALVVFSVFLKMPSNGIFP